MRNGFIKHLNPHEKLLYFGMFFLLGWFLAQVISVILCVYVFNIDFENFDFRDFSRMDVVRLNKILNFVMHLVQFIIPAIIFAKLVSFEPKSFLQLEPPKKQVWIIVPFMFIGLSLLNGLFFNLNHAIDFSFISKGFQDSLVYEQALREKAIYAYIGPTWKSFWVNIFLIAFIPAIGEELTFRGILPHLFTKAFKNVHLSVFLSALIFAVIHFQPFNLLPIFALGIAYGYIAVYFGSIWITILLHFANNALQISLTHFSNIYGWGEINTPLYLDLLLVLVSAGVVLFFIKKYPTNSKWNETMGKYRR